MEEKSSFELPNSFAGIGPEEYPYKKSKIVILPIPLEKTTSYSRGTEKGPEAIIEASKCMEIYEEETGKDPSELGIFTDMSFMNSDFSLSTIDESLDRIEKHTLNLLKDDKFIVSLGGEHSITIGLIKAFRKHFKEDFTVVQLDAHADLRDSYEGSKNSHACVMKRMLDENKIVQIGIRSLSKNEAVLINKKKLKINWANEKIDTNFLKNIISQIKTQKVYITFDCDFLDPSIMPSVGTPEPGGIGYYDATRILKELIKKKELIGIDFNELAPIKSLHHPDFLISKLVYKTLAYNFYK